MEEVLELNTSTKARVVEGKYFSPNQELHSFANNRLRWDLNSSTHKDPSLQRNLSKLNEFLALPENWNGSGALRFQLNLISFVRSLVLKLDPQPEIFPTGRNSIQMEYEKEDGDYLEFEVFSDHVNCFEIIDGKENELEILPEQIFPKVQEFTSPRPY